MTLRAVVLADTHMPRRAQSLPDEVVKALKTTDLIIHLGDFNEPKVVEMLESFDRLHAVHGNNDDHAIRQMFPPVARLSIEGHDVVLMHGHEGGRSAIEAARGRPQLQPLEGRALCPTSCVWSFQTTPCPSPAKWTAPRSVFNRRIHLHNS